MFKFNLKAALIGLLLSIGLVHTASAQTIDRPLKVVVNKPAQGWRGFRITGLGNRVNIFNLWAENLEGSRLVSSHMYTIEESLLSADVVTQWSAKTLSQSGKHDHILSVEISCPRLGISRTTTLYAGATFYKGAGNACEIKLSNKYNLGKSVPVPPPAPPICVGCTAI